MKSTIFTKTLMFTGALLFSTLLCMAQNDPADQLVGTWKKSSDMGSATLTLSADKKTTVEFTGDDVIDVWGSYEISGTKITLTDEGGDYSSGQSGTYTFEFIEDSLRFTIVNDPVLGRSRLVKGSWAKVDEPEE
jgi:hypothetical protein